jgi:hypothetical protein
MMKQEVPARVILTGVQPNTNIAEHIEKEVIKAGLPIAATKNHRLVLVADTQSVRVLNPDMAIRPRMIRASVVFPLPPLLGAQVMMLIGTPLLRLPESYTPRLL